MTYNQFLEGLIILGKYRQGNDCLGAEHDQINFYANEITEYNDILRLYELGWEQPNQPFGKYSPDEAWAAIT